MRVRRRAFNEIQSRIKSIALVHEKLYENETFADVDLADYLNDLLKMIHFHIRVEGTGISQYQQRSRQPECEHQAGGAYRADLQ
jgi:two-component sensor histidine kinase